MDIIVDIDGTIANCEHRQIHVRNKPKDWKAFFRAIPEDTPHDDIIMLVRLLYEAGHTIILCSGRSEKDRKATEEWLVKHEFTFYVKLYMRAAMDYRPDYIIKEELLGKMREEGYAPKMAIDDRSSVVAMWRRNGLRCLQVADGDF